MTLRYRLLNASVLAAAGGATSYPHGITDHGVATAPTIWWWVPSSAPAAGLHVYRVALPTTTQTPSVAGSGVATPTVDFFCSLPHSIIG